jgi:hypothetical protein
MALEKCEERFTQELNRVQTEWAGERRQMPFHRPSLALVAMRKTAEKLAATQSFDPEGSLAKQLAEREMAEARLAQKRIAQTKEAEITEIRAQRDAARAEIIADFERRRKAAAAALPPGTLPRPRAGPTEPDIVRPALSGASSLEYLLR